MRDLIEEGLILFGQVFSWLAERCIGRARRMVNRDLAGRRWPQKGDGK